MTRTYRYFSGFTCENNIKIDSKKVCNGVYDCKWTHPINPFDVSDEKNCCKFPYGIVSFDIIIIQFSMELL